MSFEIRKISNPILASILLAFALAGTNAAVGAPYCCTVGDYSGWSGADFLKDTGPIIADSGVSGNSEGSKGISAPASEVAASGASKGSVETSAPASEVVLNVDANPESYIPGAIHVDYRELLDGSAQTKSISEISGTLGDAGISRNDSIVIYGEDPSVTTYVYLILDYLGQERVELQEGGIEGWRGTGKPTQSAPTVRSSTDYIPVPRSDIIATFEYIKVDGIQVVDARSSREYSVGSISGSRNIPHDAVLNGGGIKGEAELVDLFSGLERDKPVVVYTNDAFDASVVWYVLKRMGYDAHLYAGDDWLANLVEVEELPETASAAESSGSSPVAAGYEKFLPPCCRG